MTRVSHTSVKGRGALHAVFVSICASAVQVGVGEILSFFSKGRCLSCFCLNCQTPTLPVPGVCDINVPSCSTQAWMLPGISVASPRRTTASPWSGGMARQPLTVTELSMRPSPEVTMLRWKCQGASKPQPKPRSQVSCAPQTQRAPFCSPPQGENAAVPSYLSHSEFSDSVCRTYQTLRNHGLRRQAAHSLS